MESKITSEYITNRFNFNELKEEELKEYVLFKINKGITFVQKLFPLEVKTSIIHDNHIANNKMINGTHIYNTVTKKCEIELFVGSFIYRTNILLGKVPPAILDRHILLSVIYTYLHEIGHAYETQTKKDFAVEMAHYRLGIGLMELIQKNKIKSSEELLKSNAFWDLVLASRNYVVEAEKYADNFIMDVLEKNNLQPFILYYQEIPEFHKDEEYYEVYAWDITLQITNWLANTHFIKENLNINELFEKIESKALKYENAKKEVRI